MPGNMAAMRLHNRLLGGLITGAQLQAELADGFALGSFRALCATRTAALGLAARADAMAVVQASALASDALLGAGTGVGRVLEALIGRSSPRLQPLGTLAHVLADDDAWALVLASPAALAAVLASPAACAQLWAAPSAWGAALASAPVMHQVASTPSVMAAIAASGARMVDVAQAPVALAAVFANPAALATFRSSTALAAAAIPVMTGATAPIGVASASAAIGGFEAWKAMDSNASSTYWQPTSSAWPTNTWLAYEFAAPVFVHQMTVTADGNFGPNNVRLEHSDNGSTWTAALTAALPVGPGPHALDVLVSARHKHWRLFCVDSHSAAFRITDFRLKGFLW